MFTDALTEAPLAPVKRKPGRPKKGSELNLNRALRKLDMKPSSVPPSTPEADGCPPSVPDSAEAKTGEKPKPKRGRPRKHAVPGKQTKEEKDNVQSQPGNIAASVSTLVKVISKVKLDKVATGDSKLRGRMSGQKDLTHLAERKNQGLVVAEKRRPGRPRKTDQKFSRGRSSKPLPVGRPKKSQQTTPGRLSIMKTIKKRVEQAGNKCKQLRATVLAPDTKSTFKSMSKLKSDEKLNTERLVGKPSLRSRRVTLPRQLLEKQKLISAVNLRQKKKQHLSSAGAQSSGDLAKKVQASEKKLASLKKGSNMQTQRKVKRTLTKSSGKSVACKPTLNVGKAQHDKNTTQKVSKEALRKRKALDEIQRASKRKSKVFTKPCLERRLSLVPPTSQLHSLQRKPTHSLNST